MSIRSLSTLNNLKFSYFTFIKLSRQFSRRSVNEESPYKVVGSRRAQEEDNNLAWKDPNFELLASSNFPFFMHGNVGPAWYDKHTTIQNEKRFIMEEVSNDTSKKLPGIICQAQSCPKVLKQTVSDLFPYRNFETSELSVITITLKPDIKVLRQNTDLETEKLAQTFVLTAKNICTKLRKSGFWADFVNPFSGRPYFATTKGNELYQTDEKFRCMDFQIIEIEKCLIVSNEQTSKRSFIGSLFTNAPARREELKHLFKIK